MNGARRCVLPAGLSCLPRLIAFVEEFCDAHHIAANDRLRLTLIAEELFTNTATHGLRGSGAGEVRIALDAEATRVTMSFEDSAPAFDPLAHLDAALADLDAPTERRRIGGFGLALVARMADRISYARDEGWNRLTLSLARGR